MCASSPTRSSCRCSGAPACSASRSRRSGGRLRLSGRLSCSPSLQGRRKYVAGARLRGAAADELHHQDLRHPQHPRRQRLPQPHRCCALGIIDQPLDLLRLQPQRRAADADGAAAALRRSCRSSSRSSASRATCWRPPPISAPPSGRPSAGSSCRSACRARSSAATFTFVLAHRRFRDAADGRRHQRLHLRADHLQPVRHRLQLAVRRGALGDPARRGVLAAIVAAGLARPRREAPAMIRLAGSAWSLLGADRRLSSFSSSTGRSSCAIFFSFFRSQSNAVQWDSFSFDAYVALAHNEGIIEAVAQHADRRRLRGRPRRSSSAPLLAFHYQRQPLARPRAPAVRHLPALPDAADHHRPVAPDLLPRDRHSALARDGDHRPHGLRAGAGLPHRAGPPADAAAEPGRGLARSRRQPAGRPSATCCCPTSPAPWSSAAILAFALSFDETLITLLVTGTDSTLPMRLWAMMRLGFTPDINALVALILVGTTLALPASPIRFVKLPTQRVDRRTDHGRQTLIAAAREQALFRRHLRRARRSRQLAPRDGAEHPAARREPDPVRPRPHRPLHAGLPRRARRSIPTSSRSR